MTQAAQLAQYGASSVGLAFKNRIINGNMAIAQRGTSFSSNGYNLDRWVAGAATAGAWTVQQTTGAPAGFINSLAFTKTTGNAPSSTEANYVYQVIEGYNIADLAWGTANAKTVTLSFWVYSGATGTFGGSVRNSATTQVYPFTYVVSSANTWTYCFVTIPGSTTGTWATDNSAGMFLFFDTGSGSTYRGTAGSWQAGNLVGATGTSTYPTSTSSGSISFTGVQLEVGSTATSFDIRPYTTELQLCQRYFCKNSSPNVVAANGNAYNDAGKFNSGVVIAYATNYAYSESIDFPVSMRTEPSTVTFINTNLPTSPTAGQWTVYTPSAWVNTTAILVQSVTSKCFNASITHAAGTAYMYYGAWTASAEL